MSTVTPSRVVGGEVTQSALDYLLVNGVSEIELLVDSLLVEGSVGSVEAAKEEIVKLESGIVHEYMDSSIHPGNDFYRFANGGWSDNVVIPEWSSESGSFYESEWATRDKILEIVKSTPGSLAHKFFISARDAQRRAERGVLPLMGDLYKVCLASSLDEFTEIMGSLATKGVTGLFGVGAEQNLSDSSKVVATIYPSEFTLVDGLQYYDRRYAAKRRRYKKQMKELLGMFGFDNIDDMARRIFTIESSAARFCLESVDAADLVKINNLYRLDEFKKLLGEVSLESWAKGAGVDVKMFEESIVTDPGLLFKLASKLGEFDEKAEVAKNWKAWLCWRVIVNSGRALSVEINDKIYQLTESYTVRPELDLRIADFISDYLGDSVAREYVGRHSDFKATALAGSICELITEAMRKRIEGNTWISEKSRLAALRKMSQLTIELGEPARYRDLSGLELGEEYYENYIAVTGYYNLSDWASIGDFVPGRWDFAPHTVNACYSTPDNAVCLPTAFTLKPWLDPELDMAANFAVFGATVGHEVSHGFDDQGAKFDGLGNLVEWWDEKDFEEFTRLGEKITEQYSALAPWQGRGECIDGELMLGENIADIVGIRVALDAFVSWLERNDGGVVIEGYTPMQRFFIGYAQGSREICRESEVEDFYFGTTHAPDEFRVNQVFRYVDEFYEAFKIGPEHKLWMDPTERVVIW